MREVSVSLGSRSYPVYVGAGILREVGDLARRHLSGERVLVVTNPTVAPLYAATVEESLAAVGFVVRRAEIPDGEEYKTLATVAALYDAALGAELERGDTVLALGGGVVGDIAGFLAATYMRGVAFVQVPTTLLAQVDSSVGGKVGVNHPWGKNLIGAFYQPRFVLADVRTLATLPLREVRAGLAEVIKYGVIHDAAFFAWLEANFEALLKLSDAAVEQAVATSCAIKAAVVSADETEKGLRAILNFGHTLGHALEAATHYERFVHGEAVAIGMVFAARLARRLGYFEPAGVERITALVRRAGLPDAIPPDIAPEALLEAMRRDKKVAAGQLTFILPEAIGKVRIVRGVSADIVRSVLVEY
ncbi:3-dehydroquinate synthase [Thermodesulfitimonas autotrophica]|uniref:3-dehydroquinate synthase n=1 Tax=Thermodesulfitimonas autotrophica TaxID=1894989 RepID=UPI002FE11F04